MAEKTDLRAQLAQIPSPTQQVVTANRSTVVSFGGRKRMIGIVCRDDLGDTREME